MKKLITFFSRFGLLIAGLLILQPFGIEAQNLNENAIAITELSPAELSDTEWIEICNTSNQSIDIEGWKFVEDGVNHGLSVHRGSSVIAGEACAIIANKADSFAQKFAAYTGTIFDSSWGSLKEEGEEIGLKDAGGLAIELFTYPPLVQDATGQERSVERISVRAAATDPTNWTLHTSGNSIGSAYVPSSPTVPAPSTISPPIPNPAPQSSPTPPPPPPAPPPQPAPPVPPAQSLAPKANAAPRAIIQVQTGTLISHDSATINFDGRSSYDPDGDTLSFVWDLGDGNGASGINPGPHTFSEPGAYVVTLTVIDERGLSGSAYQVVQVLRNAPQKGGPNRLLEQNNFSKDGTLFEVHGFLTLIPTSQSKSEDAKKNVAVFSPLSQTAKPRKLTASLSALPRGEAASQSSRDGNLSRHIQITELMPSPRGSADDEWIEIYNSGSETVNLGNWTITDGAKKRAPYRLPDSIILRPGSYLVLEKKLTRIALNNGSDSLVLADFTGQMVDTASYTKAKKGHSYARLQGSDGSGTHWSWQKNPTPGVKNPEFKRLEGRVSSSSQSIRLTGGDAESVHPSIQLTLADGSTKELEFDASEISREAAEAFLEEGSQVELDAEVGGEDEYHVEQIASVAAPAKETDEKNSSAPWVIGGLILVTFFLNRSSLVYGLRSLHESARAKYEERFGKDKGP